MAGNDAIKIIETPRDGLQGLKDFVPTGEKISYINKLLEVGFDTVEVGSFVSSEVIPQMKDTAEVLQGLDKGTSTSRIMVLVTSKKRGEEAAKYGIIDDLLFPFSVSPTFLKININSDFDKSNGIIQDLLEICDKSKKKLIVYITMGFGNPYGDKWDPGIVEEWVGYLYDFGQRIIPLSDILGNVTPEIITTVYSKLIKTFPDIEFGIHLHARPGEYYEKVDAAYQCGIRRFDSVTGGFGGCPMTGDELVSNLDTHDLVEYCEKNKIPHGLDLVRLGEIKNFTGFL